MAVRVGGTSNSVVYSSRRTASEDTLPNNPRSPQRVKNKPTQPKKNPSVIAEISSKGRNRSEASKLGKRFDKSDMFKSIHKIISGRQLNLPSQISNPTTQDTRPARTVEQLLPAVNFINGMGGADTIYGSNQSDHILIEGWRNFWMPVAGSYGTAQGTLAVGGNGDDRFRYYTNHPYFPRGADWIAPQSTISGGEGVDTLIVSGESVNVVKNWDLTNINMTSIEYLVLGWDPGPIDLNIKLTSDQFNQIQKMYVEQKNLPSNVKLYVDNTLTSTSKTEALSTSNWENLYYPSLQSNVTLGTAAGNIIDKRV